MNSSHDTGPQALNNSCSHYIREFQILCLKIVSEHVHDSTKAYRLIYISFSYQIYICEVVYISEFVIENMIGCDWMVWMLLYAAYVCMYRMTNGRLEVRIFLLFMRTMTTFYSTPYYFLCNAYCYSIWVNQVFVKFILPN